MTGASAESWARLRLVQGDSSAQVWELVASRGQTTLTVGSGPSSSWVIREEGVRPLHFSLHWDGTTLRIADTYGAGDVRLDGVVVTAQWRSIAGRVRIDFGKAAMVAETSAGVGETSTVVEAESHPLDPSPLPPMVAGSQHKSTILGVMSPLAADPPVELVTLKSDSGAPPNGSSPPPSGGASDSNPPSDGFRVARPSDSERARKATLMGIAISAPPPAAVPEIRVPDAGGLEPGPNPSAEARNGEPKKQTTPPRGIPSGTLIGVVGPLEARVQRLAGNGQDVKLSDKRTMLGVPLRDLQVPQISTNTETPGVVTQAEVRNVAASPAGAQPTERIGSTWQEIPNNSRPASSGPPPMAVLVEPGAGGLPPGAATQGPGARRVDHDMGAHGYDPRGPGGTTYGGRDRVSDIPTQMRDMASFDSRRPKRGIPLRYIGIVVLTAAAYMAWLYLLDHL